MINYKEILYTILKPYMKLNEFNQEIINFYYIAQKYQTVEEFVSLIQGVEKPSHELTRYALESVRSFKVGKDELIHTFPTLLEIRPEHMDDLKLIPRQTQSDNSIKALNQLVVNILGERETILDYGCGQGDFLMEYADRYPYVTFSGIDVDKDSVMLAKIRFDLLEYNTHFIVEDGLKENAFFRNNRLFDGIYANFPLKLKPEYAYPDSPKYFKRYPFFNIPSMSLDWRFVAHVSNLLSPTGLACVLMTPSSLFSVSEADFRRQLIEYGLVKAVIDLPQRTLSRSNFSTSLLVLSHGNTSVKFIDASDAFYAQRNYMSLDNEEILLRYHEDTEHSIRINNEDLLKDDVEMVPKNLILKHSIQIKNAVPIDEYLKDVFRGIQLNKSDIENYVKNAETYKEYNFKLLSLADFDQVIDEKRLTKLNIPRVDKVKRYQVKPMDIILTARGTVVKIAYVPQTTDTIIASGNVLVIRVDQEKIDPLYVYMFLRSKEGLKSLESIKKGTVIQSINPSDVKTLSIPLINRNKQEQLKERFLNLSENKKNLEKELNTIESSFEALYEEIYTE